MSNACVGFGKPLFLNGAYDVSNLELIDGEVYWVLHGQLLQQTRNLPKGTKIDSVIISDPN